MSDINIEQLSDTITQNLSTYNSNVKKKINEKGKQISKETLKKVKQKSPKRRGKYKKGWTIKTNADSVNAKSYTIHNKTSYQLTHLLEHGHAKVNGGRTRAIEHIEPAEQEAIAKFLKAVKEVIQNE